MRRGRASEHLLLAASPPDVRKGSAFPVSVFTEGGYASFILDSTEAQPPHSIEAYPERQGLSAHQAAEPRAHIGTAANLYGK